MRGSEDVGLPWQVKAGEVLADEGVVQLKALESLVSEAARIPVILPDAKVQSGVCSFCGSWLAVSGALSPASGTWRPGRKVRAFPQHGSC